MTTTFDQAMPARGAAPGILDRERIIATAGFNRWLVPPAALCIHLCIGMAYGFSAGRGTPAPSGSYKKGPLPPDRAAIF